MENHVDNTSENKPSLYKRFMSSKAFYPITLGLIAALCVSIWAINRSNKLMMTTSPISQNALTGGDFLDEPTTAVQNTTAKQTDAAKQEKTTYAYESNKAYKGEWMLPVSGDPGKDFSAGTLVKSETMGDYRVHNGIDIIAKKGSEVKAVNSGKVLEVYNDAFWGTVVVIDHGGEVVAKYCGLGNKTQLAQGQIVEKGTVLGTLALVPCEQKDESHLHFEMTVTGDVQDPIAVMNMNAKSE